MKVPSISVITCSYNCRRDIWTKTLQSLKEQNYPPGLIEHIVIDGGSTNDTIAIAKSYGCKVFRYPHLTDFTEYRKGLAVRKAKNDIILILEDDNILPNRNWLRQMVEPFMKNPGIVGAYSAYNTYEPDMPLLTKYSALIGANDPTIVYLRKSEKLMSFERKYNKGTVVVETKKYTVVRFDKRNLPTLGDNGHMVRRSALMKVCTSPKDFKHTDAFANLLRLGYDTYGVVNNAIIHYTGSNIFNYYKRRLVFKSRFYDVYRGTRTYYVYNPSSGADRIHLITYVVCSLTFVQPLYISMKGYLYNHEPAWFLHPVMCFLGVVSYAVSELLRLF